MRGFGKCLRSGFLVAAVGLVMGVAPFGLDLEQKAGLDLLFRLRGVRTPPPDVLIVTTDEKSAVNLNVPRQPRKWPRSLHALVTDRLADGGASVISFDLHFEEARPGEEDSRLAESLHRAGNVVLCEYLKKENAVTPTADPPPGIKDIERVVPPIPPLAKSAVALAPFPLPKVPVKVSQYWAFKSEAGDLPTLPVVAYQVFTLPVYGEFIRLLKQAEPSRAGRLPDEKESLLGTSTVENTIQEVRGIFEADRSLGKRLLEGLGKPDGSPGDAKRKLQLQTLIRMYAGDNSPYLNFYGPAGTIPTLRYDEVLRVGENPQAPGQRLDFRGKAVFVGMLERSNPDQKDGFHTVFSDSGGLDLSGVEIAATAFSNLLEDRPVRPLPSSLQLPAIVLWGLLLGMACRLLSPLGAALTLAGAAAAWLAAALYAFQTAGAWFPVAVPLMVQAPLAFIAGVLGRSVEATRERHRIRKSLRYYLPDRVVDQLGKDVQDFAAVRQVVYGICLYTDAARYTTISETMEPEELGRFMNDYYAVLFKPIRQHGGIVSGTAGDSMLAVWVKEKADAVARNHACQAALDISEGVVRFNETSGGRKLPTRIGLHSGPVLLSNIGAMDHYEYKAMGDIVNSASRIEGLNKLLGTLILASDEVLGYLDGFVSRPVGEFLLVGKTRPLAIRELMCRAEESNRQLEERCAAFAESLEAFRSRAWDEAMEGFEECNRICGSDGPSRFYFQLCERYRGTPPEEPWNGVVCPAEK